MRHINNSVSIAIFACFLVACDFEERQTEPYSFTELAMEENMIIRANNKNGEVAIEWLAPLKRRYKWDGYDETRTLIPRKTRWLGALGAYDPATASIFSIFYTTRIVAEDSRLDFKSIKDLKAWLYQGSAVMDWVYTDDGWVVGFAKSPRRNQVNIDVIRLSVNGKFPSKLEGSRPGNISISYLRK